MEKLSSTAITGIDDDVTDITIKNKSSSQSLSFAVSLNSSIYQTTSSFFCLLFCCVNKVDKEPTEGVQRKVAFTNVKKTS